MVAMCRRPLKARETGLFFIKFTSLDMLGGVPDSDQASINFGCPSATSEKPSQKGIYIVDIDIFVQVNQIMAHRSNCHVRKCSSH
jgi:hypothetical protein